MTEKMKPCPFCGSPAELYPDGEQEGHFVMCSGAGAPCHLQAFAHTTEADAVAAWNRRACQSHQPPSDRQALLPAECDRQPPLGEAEPQWDAVREAAEVATGLPVERHTYSIIIREIRRWIAEQASQRRANWLRQHSANIPHPSRDGMRVVGFVVPAEEAPPGLVSHQLADVIEAKAKPQPLNLAKVTFDGDSYLICHFGDLIDVLPEHVHHGGTYVVEHVQMTQAEFDALPEFEG